ncbi:MAG: nitroreductase family protein [Candidatus Thorarchaeota archaeon]|jgi:nitroreductase
MMDILDLVMKRRHIHHFDSDPVSAEDLRTLLEAARWAPSAGNLQPWEIIVINSDEDRNALVDVLKRKEYMRSAPLVLVFCADLSRSSGRYGDRGSSLYAIQDTTAAIQNVLLTATGLGLGSGWVGDFDEKALTDLFKLPPDVRPMALIMIGKPKENPTPPSRREVEDFTHIGEFGKRLLRNLT